MTRVKQKAPVSQYEVLDHLVRSLQPGENFVQIGVSVEHPAATKSLHGVGLSGSGIGMLHLGSGCHEQLDSLMPMLTRAAIVVFEDASPDSPAYDYAIGWSARGYLSSPVSARHWPDLGIATYLGATK